jgi:hypothetical protein
MRHTKLHGHKGIFRCGRPKNTRQREQQKNRPLRLLMVGNRWWEKIFTMCNIQNAGKVVTLPCMERNRQKMIEFAVHHKKCTANKYFVVRFFFVVHPLNSAWKRSSFPCTQYNAHDEDFHGKNRYISYRVIF